MESGSPQTMMGATKKWSVLMKNVRGRGSGTRSEAAKQPRREAAKQPRPEAADNQGEAADNLSHSRDKDTQKLKPLTGRYEPVDS